GRARTRSDTRVLDQPARNAGTTAVEQSASRCPFRHRLTAEAAALVQPTLSVRVVARWIAESDAVGGVSSCGAMIEPRRGGPIADAACGLFCVVVGSEARRLRESRVIAGDDRPVVSAQ